MSYQKNVFVLGAGFSRDAGAPLMNDFFGYARNLKDDPGSTLGAHDREIFGHIIEYRFNLNRALAKILVDLDNIEQLFGFLEMDLQLSGKLGNDLRHDMKYLIARTLEVATNKPEPRPPCGLLVSVPEGGHRHHPFKDNGYAFFVGFAAGLWNPLKRSDGNAVDAVISFNYDLVLEREMRKLGIRPEYCCGESSEFYRGAFGDSKSCMKLLKLHGSVNWLGCPKCKRLYFLEPTQAKVASFREHACQQCGTLGLQPLIVPPTWNKGIEETYLRSVWSEALAQLSTAGRIFIVGYSMPETDQFFKYMLGLALAQNDQLTEIYVLNPAEEVGNTFSRLFNPYFDQRVVKFHSTHTLDFISKIQEKTGQRETIREANLDSNFS